MTDWFDAARFGMFVHRGHVAQRGIEIRWPLVGGADALHPSHASLATGIELEVAGLA